MDIFWAKVVLSFIVGSLWITATTIIAERYGSKLGGWVGGLPSTILIGLFFIGFAQGTPAATQATVVVPITVGFSGLFLLTYVLLVKRGFLKAIIASLGVWFLLSAAVVSIDLSSLFISTLVWIILLIFSYLAFAKIVKTVKKDAQKIKYTKKQVIGRILFSGAVISFAVIMSKMGGPIYGGIFSSFPAMFLSTIIITYKSKGEEFSRQIAKSLMISGLINVPVFAIAVRFTYPTFGLVLGTIIAYGITFVSAFLTYKVIHTKE